MKLEELAKHQHIKGIIPNTSVTVVSVDWYGNNAVKLTYEDNKGYSNNRILYREDEEVISIVDSNCPWAFDGNGSMFRLTAESQRIRLAHLYDPLLAIHTSKVDPLPHQITAVYDVMLRRQPLRFLLADDPGAGKTIMTGLLIKELVMRGELKRCLIVCPGSLVEQWQDELFNRFQLNFDIMTNETYETARSGNWFYEHPFAIARLDKLSRNEDVHQKIKLPDDLWDLIVCDEAHKLSASYFSGDVHKTKRYKLGELLSAASRHFLLLTATPHNGKDIDFQLFMALLDGDRFVGSFRDGSFADVSDMMRRMVKESLVKFDATPLFPDRIAQTVPYKLTDLGAVLYTKVTDYVKEQFNLADRLEDKKKGNAVGFALTILQRRLASSPEAIYQSLCRRRSRLEKTLRELEIVHRGSELIRSEFSFDFDDDEIAELDDNIDTELVQDNNIIDLASAARNISQLKEEIETLSKLEKLALDVKNSEQDPKWLEVSELLSAILSNPPQQSSPNPSELDDIDKNFSPKLVVFTEHRDTLNYLFKKITGFLGDPDVVAVIHGGIGREERQKAQEQFINNPSVKILLATDAAGEGINLQRANKMINYDLPWNPNRIEQRFGRIHRIGQTEVCHLWNLVATETREGDVYRTLLEKLEVARESLGGKVFDVLGQLQFEGETLKKLLIEAIRYGDLPEVRDKLLQKIDNAFNPSELHKLLSDNALAHEALGGDQVKHIRANMERAEARRLQPYYIETYFIKAFQMLGGTLHQRENRRFEITNVPRAIRERARSMGATQHITPKYERIVFEKKLIAKPGFVPAQFVCPGHPLLDATIDLILEQNHGLLKAGTILIDDNADHCVPKVVFYLEHAINDATKLNENLTRTVSKRLLFIEIDPELNFNHIEYPPYLDYRPLKHDAENPADNEPTVADILNAPECQWISPMLEDKTIEYAIANVVPKHLVEVKNYRLDLISRTRKAVYERLNAEINYWEYQALKLFGEEAAGKPNAKLNSNEAQKRADDLKARLDRRLATLDLERQISALMPTIYGGFLVIPKPLLDKIAGKSAVATPTFAKDTIASGDLARKVVMESEQTLGYEPKDVETLKLGYDIESYDPKTGKLRFIEVKGRVQNARTLTVTRNEVLYSFNKPDDYILAIVEFKDDGTYVIHHVLQPFTKEPDFDANSINYDLQKLIARGVPPS